MCVFNIQELPKCEEDMKETSPVVYLVTKHDNGTLNLWQLIFADKSKFSQVLSIGHKSRASGHRFRVNDITCHPVLPLLLTTSHHNIVDQNKTQNNKNSVNLHRHVLFLHFNLKIVHNQLSLFIYRASAVN